MILIHWLFLSKTYRKAVSHLDHGKMSVSGRIHTSLELKELTSCFIT